MSLSIGLGEAEAITGLELLLPGGKVARIDVVEPLRGVIQLDEASAATE